MLPDQHRDRIILSRYFDENTYLVAGMSWKSYSECNDVKIIGINRTFLNETKQDPSAKDLKHCQGNFFELDCDISDATNVKVTMTKSNENCDFVRKNDENNLYVSQDELVFENSSNSIENIELPNFTGFKTQPEDLVLEKLNHVIHNIQKRMQKSSSDTSQSNPTRLITQKELTISSTSLALLNSQEHLEKHTHDIKEDILEEEFYSKPKIMPANSLFYDDKNEMNLGYEYLEDSGIVLDEVHYNLQEMQDIIGVSSPYDWCFDSGYFANFYSSSPRREEYDSSGSISIEILRESEGDLYSKFFLPKPECCHHSIKTTGNFGREITKLSPTSEGFGHNDLEDVEQVRTKIQQTDNKILNGAMGVKGNMIFLPRPKDFGPDYVSSKFFLDKTENYDQNRLIPYVKPLISTTDPILNEAVFKKCQKVIFDIKNEIKNLDQATLKRSSENYVLTPPLWHPPKSPHNLIEEDLYHDPWALLVATIFLNRTSAKCARRYIEGFLEKYPNPFEVLMEEPLNFEKYFKKIGLQTVRSLQVWKMSHDYVTKDWKSVHELYGVGKYGTDAFKMFCLGNFDVQPEDRYLRIYKAWYERVYNKNSEDFDAKFRGAVGYRDEEWLLDGSSTEISDFGSDFCEVDEHRGGDMDEN